MDFSFSFKKKKLKKKTKLESLSSLGYFLINLRAIYNLLMLTLFLVYFMVIFYSISDYYFSLFCFGVVGSFIYYRFLLYIYLLPIFFFFLLGSAKTVCPFVVDHDDASSYRMPGSACSCSCHGPKDKGKWFPYLSSLT